MTIHITLLGALAFIGVGALGLFVLYILFGFISLWLFAGGMRGKRERRKDRT